MGQKRPVQVYLMISENTIEENLLSLGKGAASITTAAWETAKLAARVAADAVNKARYFFIGFCGVESTGNKAADLAVLGPQCSFAGATRNALVAMESQWSQED